MNCRSGNQTFLSPDDVQVFGLIAGGKPLPDGCADSVARLADLGFVKIDTDGENRPVALNPEDITQRSLDALLTEAADRVAKMRDLHRMSEQLSAQFERGRSLAGGGSEYIDDPAVVNARLDDIISSAGTEILSAQPGGPRTKAQLERSVDRDRASLARGVRLCTLYRDSVRQSTAMADHIRTMTGHGAQYRTMIPPYERAIIVDGQHAFVSAYGVEGAPAHAAWHVTDPAAVGFIGAAFVNAWQLAQPWKGEPRTGPAAGWEAPVCAGQGVDTISGPDSGVRTTALERAILRDMIDGIQQRTTATRLGISPRTLAKHIEELKAKFQAVSPAQLGFKFAHSPDCHVDDSTPALGGNDGAPDTRYGAGAEQAA